MQNQIDYEALAKQFGAKPAAAGQPDYDALAKQHGATPSIPNPTGKPLGAEIPDDVGISIPGFAMEFGKEALRQGKEAITDPRTYAAMVSRRIPVMATAVAGAEGLRQIGQHVTGSPEAPQTSEEAAMRIAKSGGVAALVGGVFKGAAAFDRRIAGKATSKANLIDEESAIAAREAELPIKEAALETELLKTQQAARLEKNRIYSQSSKENAATRRKAASDLFVARKQTREALTAARKAKLDAELLAKQQSSASGKQGAQDAAETFGPATNFPKATEGLIARSKALFNSGIKDLYDTFRASPASQQLFDISEIKLAATEIIENNAANPPAILRKIVDGPDEVALSLAEDFLSELKGASHARFVGRTKSQGMAARIQNELQPQIEHALESQGEAGVAALRALRGGRALRRHFGKTFEDEVAPGVAKVLRQGGNPMQIVQNPVKLKSFVEQAGPEGLPVLRRKLFDEAARKSVNPQTGEFSAEKWATELNKFRHALTPEQRALGDSLARGNAAELLALEKATAQELQAIRSVYDEVTTAIRASAPAKNAALSRETRDTIAGITNRTQTERLNMRLKGTREIDAIRDEIKAGREKIKATQEGLAEQTKKRKRMIMLAATIAGASGASLVAARTRAVGSMFDALGLEP